MKTVTPLLLAAALGLAGCGGKPTGTPIVPLRVEDWKAMPSDQKYTAQTLERLKEGDPKLQTAEGWELFSRTALPEARKRDFPRGKRNH
jgi:hypothetical protein